VKKEKVTLQKNVLREFQYLTHTTNDNMFEMPIFFQTKSHVLMNEFVLQA